MSLFKKKEKTGSCCCCDGDCGCQGTEAVSSRIKILGNGCQKCNDLEKATSEALSELGMDETIEHVTDLVQIASYGVMSTPALVIDGRVVSLGKVLKKDEIIKLIQNA